MGSSSDWETMRNAAVVLERFGVAHEVRVVSAHRTPDLLVEYATSAAGAGPAGHHRRGRRRRPPAGHGGGAHDAAGGGGADPLPAPQGLDSLLSIVQMPAGVPVATMAIGPAGATNAALWP